MNRYLVSTETSLEIDEAAQKAWGFNTYSLVEAAGQSCARVFSLAFPSFFDAIPRIVVMAGSGNNGADALVMLRYWILSGQTSAAASAVLASSIKESETPSGSLIFSLRKMGVPVIPWEEGTEIPAADLILDGIAGTGIRGPLKGIPAEMAAKLNALTRGKPRRAGIGGRDERKSTRYPLDKETIQRPLVVSVDLPSGLSDEWTPDMPAVSADICLAIEPQKYCLYNPAARSRAGTILSVGGIFPGELIETLAAPGLSCASGGPELLDWDYTQKLISPIRPDAHKYQRGTAEIHAGSSGFAGAARICGRGAQAVGAGLVRLVVDEEIYPILASQSGGIMVFPGNNLPGINPGGSSVAARFKPDALLLGPGWGVISRNDPLEAALELEKSGTPLILDADGIGLARDRIFHGNTLITPHAGEFAAYTALPLDDILCRPIPILLKFAVERKTFILLKSNVMIIAAPDGRCGIIDGMAPNLASGGSGDLLAGFCAGLAGRMAKEGSLDLYAAAAAAATLFIRAGKSKELSSRFIDPLELADKAADLAGLAWL